ncbi:GGDEF domain-containing phosphodiesterase [Phenylobacterium sp.]|uniref:putative bifunctional diguanylate cyclase/phosphodiesterase n=1 Tax=Phenylobacterium sp. TaxID=1871053 RepID=UPI002E3476BB|nr:GGDEF domain-containing phosphodiesterase [Phenylobacterium sp.]HEX2559634.1 GGDEF domain-containing phosphodiesterase [Phenylobacterium sp.]
MSTPGLEQASRLSRPLGYRGQILALAALAASLPLLLLVASGDGASLAFALAGVGLALTALALRLRPVDAAARLLRELTRVGQGEAAGSPRFGSANQMLADVRQIASTLEALRHRLSNRHPLTELQTREPFLAGLQDHLDQSTSAVVLGAIRFGDYDRLAAFDQTAADKALKAFAARLQEAVGRQRPLAQVDRDCFAIWFKELGPETAASELQAIAYVLSQEIRPEDLKISPDVGVGAAIFPDDAADAATLLTRAYAALPKPGQPAKALSFFSPRSSTEARERYALEQDLRTAVSGDQLLLYFQPVVDLSERRCIGAEALLRWRHPERGLVSPGEFMPVLEQSGMMAEVGLWVLNAACREARAWEEAGLMGLKVAVNLSAVQFLDPGLNTIIVRTLERHGLSPHSLELELTETAAMADVERTRRMFGELRELGVSVAIDDFGAGYSSLSSLQSLPFSKLKIDREFVSRVDERREGRAICTALIELSLGLEIEVLAEGAETLPEVQTLHALGCNLFQGFYFARPMPGADFVRTLKDPAWLEGLAPAPAPKRRAPQRIAR